MEFKNITSFDEFKKLNEELGDIENTTSFSQSLLGRGLISLFKLFKKGVDYVRLEYFKRKLENELAAGVLRYYNEYFGKSEKSEREEKKEEIGSGKKGSDGKVIGKKAKIAEVEQIKELQKIEDPIVVYAQFGFVKGEDNEGNKGVVFVKTDNVDNPYDKKSEDELINYIDDFIKKGGNKDRLKEFLDTLIKNGVCVFYVKLCNKLKEIFKTSTSVAIVPKTNTSLTKDNYTYNDFFEFVNERAGDTLNKTVGYRKPIGEEDLNWDILKDKGKLKELVAWYTDNTPYKPMGTTDDDDDRYRSRSSTSSTMTLGDYRKQGATNMVNKPAVAAIQDSVQGIIYHKETPVSSMMYPGKGGGLKEEETSMAKRWRVIVNDVLSQYKFFLNVDDINPLKLEKLDPRGTETTKLFSRELTEDIGSTTKSLEDKDKVIEYFSSDDKLDYKSSKDRNLDIVGDKDKPIIILYRKKFDPILLYRIDKSNKIYIATLLPKNKYFDNKEIFKDFGDKLTIQVIDPDKDKDITNPIISKDKYDRDRELNVHISNGKGKEGDIILKYNYYDILIGIDDNIREKKLNLRK